MRILAIGDIHGKNIWKKAVANIAADVIVFVGDYVNAKQWIGDSNATENLRELIDFKKKHVNAVKLLLGNHDILFTDRSSILRKMFFPSMNPLYTENLKSFDVAYAYHHYLFTHAGVSNPWYKRHKNLIDTLDAEPIASKLNLYHRSNIVDAIFEKGPARGGTDFFGGPIYADKSETEIAPLDGLIQIVGHSKVKEPSYYRAADGGIIYIDCLNSENRFLLIENDKLLAVNAEGDSSPIKEVAQSRNQIATRESLNS